MEASSRTSRPCSCQRRPRKRRKPSKRCSPQRPLSGPLTVSRETVLLRPTDDEVPSHGETFIPSEQVGPPDPLTRARESHRGPVNRRPGRTACAAPYSSAGDACFRYGVFFFSAAPQRWRWSKSRKRREIRAQPTYTNLRGGPSRRRRATRDARRTRKKSRSRT
jgi:hypothetical protein